jgi:hypothetical protein
MLNLWPSPLRPRDGDDIKSSGAAQQIVLLEKRESQARQTPLLVVINGLRRVPCVGGTSRFYFDKNNTTPLHRHQVQFAQSIAASLGDDVISTATQETSGQSFTLRA